MHNTKLKIFGNSLHSLLNSPLFITVILFFIYLIIAFLLPEGGYFSGDQGVKFSQIDALARFHSLSVGTINEKLSIFRPDFDSFYRKVDAGYQAIFSPAYSVIVLPFYLLFGMKGLVVPSIIGVMLSAYGSGLIAKTVGIKYAGLVSMIVGLASPLIFYAFILWEHTISVGIIVIATYLVLKTKFFTGGLLVAIAIWFRPEMMIYGLSIVFAILAIFGIRNGLKNIIRLSLGLIAGISPWWIFNFIYFGNPLGPQVAQNSIITESRLDVIALHLLPLGQRKWILLLAFVLVFLVMLRLKHRSPVIALSFLFGGIFIINLVHLNLYSSGAAPSMTDVFPFAFASLVSLIWMNKQKQIGFIFILTVSYLIVVTLVTPTWGGGGWGPRMLLGVFPLFAVLGANSIQISRGFLLKLSCVALLISSVVIQAAGLQFLGRQQKQWVLLNNELLSLEPNIVATAVWWLPQVGTSTIQNIRWYGVKDEDDLKILQSMEECFWWISTDEPTSDWWEFQLHHVSSLPASNLGRLLVKKIPVRGLEAVLYCASSEG